MNADHGYSTGTGDPMAAYYADDNLIVEALGRVINHQKAKDPGTINDQE